MIVIMTTLEIVLIVFGSHCYEDIPIWAKVLCLLASSTIHLIAYASEDILREKIKKLEAEVKELKKGGAE